MSYNKQDLVNAALKARDKSYSPYSSFCVGAALLCDDGEMFEGANIENAAYGAVNCAERTAFFTALMNEKKKFRAIAIVGAKRGEEVTSICAPCGICRQVMAEFCEPDFEIVLFDGKTVQTKTLDELLPAAFDKSNL